MLTLPDDLIPIADAARLLPGSKMGKHRHVASLYRYTSQGRLRRWRIGNRSYVSRAEVLALVQPVSPKRVRPGAAGVMLNRAEEERETQAVLRRHGLA